MTRQEKCRAVQVAIRQRIHDLEVEKLRAEIAAETDIPQLLAALELWEQRAEVETLSERIRELNAERARRWDDVAASWSDPYELSDQELDSDEESLRARVATIIEAYPDAAKLGVLDEGAKND